MRTYFPMSLGKVCNDTSLSAKWASVLSWVKPSGNLKQNTEGKLWIETHVIQLIGSLQSHTLMTNSYSVWRSLFDQKSHGHPGICSWSAHNRGLKNWISIKCRQFVCCATHCICHMRKLIELKNFMTRYIWIFQHDSNDEHSYGLFLWRLPG